MRFTLAALSSLTLADRQSAPELRQRLLAGYALRPEIGLWRMFKQWLNRTR